MGGLPPVAEDARKTGSDFPFRPLRRVLHSLYDHFITELALRSPGYSFDHAGHG